MKKLVVLLLIIVITAVYLPANLKAYALDNTAESAGNNAHAFFGIPD